MAGFAFPFDAGPGAGVAEAGWTSMASLWMDNGVVDGVDLELEVFADNTGLQVKLRAGAAWIDGVYYHNDAQMALAITTPHTSLVRLDTVAIRVDWSGNTATAIVLAGVAGSGTGPTLYSLPGSLRDYPLAQVRVEPQPSTTILATKVTDQRLFPRLDRHRLPGELLPWAAPLVPRGWLACDGSAVSRTTYARLFTAIGNYWGNGDGSTTFNVPDFRGRVAVGLDNMGGTAANVVPAAATLGGTGGAATHTLSPGELAGHAHGIAGSTPTSGGVSSGHTHQIDPPSTNSSTETASHSHPASAAPTAATESTHTHSVDPPNTTSAVTAGSHAHTVPALAGSTTDPGGHSHNVPTQTTTLQAGATSTQQPNAGGTNTVATASAGAHTHTVTTTANTTGSHTDDHSHTLDILAFPSAAGSSHGHAITMGTITVAVEDALHQHSVDILAFPSGPQSPDHTHDTTIPATTTATTGGNLAHNNMPPYATTFVLIKT